MKNLKKVLALVVVFAMMMSTVAFASYPDVDTTADYAGAVELLSALDILKGDDQGNFNPDNTITRAEFAAVVCRALGLENSANSAKGATIFTDVAADHWATGYINLASQQGIINGKGNGIFDPEGNVTFAEAVKMLVVAIGYEPMAKQRGAYPTGYLTVANSTKMTAGISAGGTDTAALRSTVAMLTANALEIPMMDQTGYGTEVTYEVLDDSDNYATLLTNMDIYVATGVVGDTDKDTGKVDFKLTEASDDYEFGWNSNYTDEKLGTETFEVADSNIEEYYQQSVNAYVYKAAKSKYEVIIAVPSGIGETLTINASDLYKGVIGSRDKAIEYYETPEATKVTKVYTEDNDDVDLYVNGVLITKDDNFDLTVFADEDATIEFVENTDDKYYDRVLVTVYENRIVDSVDVEELDDATIRLTNGAKINLDLEDEDLEIKIVDKDGADMDIADFQEYDVLAIVVGGDGVDPETAAIEEAKNVKDDITIMNIGQSQVTGSITEASDEYIYIDGTEYEVAEFADGNEADVFEGATVETAILGTEGMFFISATGKIIGFDGTAGVNANYGYILQAKWITSGFENGWNVKMLTKEGIATYEFYSSVKINGEAFTSNDPIPDDYAVLKAFEDDTKFADDADTRIVEYKVTSDGKIKNLEFVAGDAFKTSEGVEVAGEFKSGSSKVGTKVLSENAVIFDVDVADLDDAKAYDLSYLVDESEYLGYAAVNKNSEYRVAVITAGSTKFAPEAGLLFVESVRSSSYGADEAVAVKYYTEGSKDLKTAIFTDDADAIGGVDYTNLSKGDVFSANMDAEGVVSEYAVIAELNVDKGVITINDAVAKELTKSANDEVGFVAGTVASIDKRGNFVIDNASAYGDYELEVIPTGATYTYNFNGNTRNGTLEVKSWDSGINPEKGTFYVFVKYCEGDVIDVYGVNVPATVTPSAPVDPDAGLADAEEVEEEVVEEEFDFE